MLEVKGNAWDLLKDYDSLCITTNGFVKKTGDCVMGRGIAYEAKSRIPDIEFHLGNLINQSGNNVYYLGVYKDKPIISFPVKHNWWENADIELIKRSCIQLEQLIDEMGLEKVLLPRPGCGNGKLKWDYVKQEIEPLLSDRVVIVSF